MSISNFWWTILRHPIAMTIPSGRSSIHQLLKAKIITENALIKK
jgi:hypothetical protein